MHGEVRHRLSSMLQVSQLRTVDHPRSVYACGILLTPFLVKDLSYFRCFRTL